MAPGLLNGLLARARAATAWLTSPVTLEELVQIMVAMGLYLAIVVFPN